MKRTSLSIKDLNEQLQQHHLEIQFSKKESAQILEITTLKTTTKIILINSQPSFFYYNPSTTTMPLLIPTLKLLQTHPNILKTITIDMGAIKYIINGADIMRPGITHIDDNIKKDEPILIIDQTHKKPLAIGISQLSSPELQTTTTGKVIKNIHYVGDELWKLEIK